MLDSPGRSSRSAADQTIEARRYLEALRRSFWLMAAIVIALSGVVLIASLLAPPRYEATTRIIVDPSIGGLQTDSGTVERELATIESVTTTPQVLQAAARAIGGTTAADLQNDVNSSVDPNANVISIVASAGDARRAATIANGVARAFLDQQRAAQSQRLDAARASLQAQIRRLQAEPRDANVTDQITALQERAAELSVDAASVGAQLQIAQAAAPPTGPSSPRPVRNVLLAIFASLLIAVLVALARDQLSPRVNSQRELRQVLGLPILGSIPSVPARYRRRGVMTAGEHEAYQSLGASLRLALPPDGHQIILVTSALHADGKTTVAMQIASLLSQSGHHTVLVSGDLRRPRLDAETGLAAEPGFIDLLLHARERGVDESALAGVLKQRPRRDAHAGTLEVLPAGHGASDPARLLTSEPVDAVFDALRLHGSTFVVVDAPPMLGVADARVLARHCDQIVIVARLSRMSLMTAADLVDALDSLDAHKLGAVVIGAKTEASPYYAGTRAPVSEPPSFVE